MLKTILRQFDGDAHPSWGFGLALHFFRCTSSTSENKKTGKFILEWSRGKTSIHSPSGRSLYKKLNGNSFFHQQFLLILDASRTLCSALRCSPCSSRVGLVEGISFNVEKMYSTWVESISLVAAAAFPALLPYSVMAAGVKRWREIYSTLGRNGAGEKRSILRFQEHCALSTTMMMTMWRRSRALKGTKIIFMYKFCRIRCFKWKKSAKKLPT